MRSISKFGPTGNLCVDMEIPVYEEQAKIIENEFAEMKRHYKDDTVFNVVFDYIQSIEGVGSSFLFKFDTDILFLAEGVQDKVPEMLDEILCDTNWFKESLKFQDIENEIDFYDKEELLFRDFVGEYITSKKVCGYKVAFSEIYEVFGKRMSHEEIHESIQGRFDLEH